MSTAESIAELDDLPALKKIKLGNLYKLTSLPKMRWLPALKSIDISHTRISSLKEAEDLPALQEIALQGSEVSQAEVSRFLDYRRQKGLAAVAIR